MRLINGSSVQSFSTVASQQPDQKVLFDKLSTNVTEFKLNAPKNLNSLDFDMVHLMLKQVKEYHTNP
jgi:enoyl-CoA hydratase/carnithine racemase